MRKIPLLLAVIAAGAACRTSPGQSAIPDELRVKREAVFDFAKEPTVARDGDRVEIRFETKGFCDCTIAIEDRNGPSTPSTSSGGQVQGRGGSSGIW